MVAGQLGNIKRRSSRMIALVIGYGSIGRRHVLNLSKLDCIDEIFVYTKIKENVPNSFKKNLSFIDASTLGLHEVIDKYKIDLAIIANETYKHIDTAIILAEKGIHILIEKPLSHNLENVNYLKKIACKNKIVVFIAYNIRFLPAIQYLKDQISENIIGDLYFAQIEVGQYLPSWRTNIKYTDSYSANVKYGGGVALDLSHEVDYMRYLFGEPFLWKTLKSKVSDLEINSEDIFEGVYKFKNGFVCHVHMDYLQQKVKRNIKIIGSKGEIVCDFIEKWIDIQTHDNVVRLTKEYLFQVEETYNFELKHFLETIETNIIPLISLDDGIKALMLLEDNHDIQ